MAYGPKREVPQFVVLTSALDDGTAPPFYHWESPPCPTAEKSQKVPRDVLNVGGKNKNYSPVSLAFRMTAVLARILYGYLIYISASQKQQATSINHETQQYVTLPLLLFIFLSPLFTDTCNLYSSF
jgi:hypothetical protein